MPAAAWLAGAAALALALATTSQIGPIVMTAGILLLWQAGLHSSTAHGVTLAHALRPGFMVLARVVLVVLVVVFAGVEDVTLRRTVG